jgi:hypothetical protein
MSKRCLHSDTVAKLCRTLFDSGPDDQSSIARRRSYEHARRIGEAPTFRHTLEAFLGAGNMCRIPALAGAKHFVTNFEVGCFSTGQR